MKPGLRRIEAMLDQLEVQSDSPVGVVNDSTNSGMTSSADANLLNREQQREIPAVKTKTKSQVEPFPVSQSKLDSAAEGLLVGQGSSVQRTAQAATEANLTQESTEAKLPVLPADSTIAPKAASTNHAEAMQSILAASQSPLIAAEVAGLSVNRQAANPNLAIGLLKEFETLVRGWQKELEQTIQQIQGVYQDGPIVDGWLESYPPGGQVAPPSASISMLRHAEIEYLMEFIEQICQAGQAQITEDMRRTNYRLCGLDPDGKMWSRPCPPEQVPYVGLAIARYQKLRALLAKKQSLENRLTNLVEGLTMLHGQTRE